MKKIISKVNSLLSKVAEKKLKIKNYRDQLPAERFIIKEPFSFKINLTSYHINSDPYWKEQKVYQSHEIYYTEVKNASIIGKGVVVNREGEVLLESTIFQKEYLQKLNVNHLISCQKLLPTRKLEKVFSVANRLDKSYYHWTLEILPRILVATQTPSFNNYKILIAQHSPSYTKESIAFLFPSLAVNIEEVKVFQRVITNTTRLIPFLHIRDTSTRMMNIYYPEMIVKLNKLAHQQIENIKDIQKKYPIHLIISRKNALQRRILNEEETVKYLGKYGFVNICLEELPFKEQLLHFYYAKKVIAVHGAGITNIIYGKNLKLLELFPKERTIRDAHYFAQISAALNFDHFLLKYKSSNINQDLRIDQKLLAKIGKTLSLKML